MQGPGGTARESHYRPILFLCGIKHSGKSTLGRRLADNHALHFYDSDDLTLAAANQTQPGPAGAGAAAGAGDAGGVDNPGAGKAGARGQFRSARELYRALGAEGFKRLETLGLDELIESAGAGQLSSSKSKDRTPRIVVALGGGVADNPEAMALISRKGYLVYLHVDAHILYERIMRRGTPAFLTSENPRAEFEELFRRRDAAYRSSADLVVELTGLGIPEALNKVDDELRRHISGW
jgi:shikimate kinase